ncbi:MAG: hypothetical protein AB8E15_02220 [Bdellovibrionales bacterium]
MANNDNWDENESKSGFIPDALKKVLAIGMGAAFLTEETIRTILNDVKLPKDIISKVLEGANRSKEDLIDRVGDEIASVIKKIDVVEEASRFVEEHKFKINAEIEVIKKDNGALSMKLSSENSENNGNL